MISFLPPDFFCSVHGNQGRRTVCKWCDERLIPKSSPSAEMRSLRPIRPNADVAAFYSGDSHEVAGQVNADVNHGSNFCPELTFQTTQVS